MPGGGRLVPGPGGGRGVHGRPPHRRLDQPDREDRVPLQLPQLVERARLARDRLRLPPGHAEQGEPVEQVAALAVVGTAQVQVEQAARRLGPQPQAALLPQQVLLDGDHRRASGHLAEPLPHHQPVVDQAHRQVAAEAEHRPGRRVQVAQVRGGPVPEGGGRLREPGRVDHLGGRRVEVLGPQQPGDLGEPAPGDVAGRRPQVVVPAGRGDPGAVAAVGHQAPVGPGRPGRLHLDPGHPLEQRGVRPGGGHRGQGGGVPGAADHGDPLEPFPDGGPDPLAHERLPGRLPRLEVRHGLAHGGHGLEHRGEQVGAVAALLDHALPPALAVVVARGPGQRTERVVADGDRRPGRGVLGARVEGERAGARVEGERVGAGVEGELVGLGQVDEPGGRTGGQRPAQRLPLWREDRERVEHGPARLVPAVDEQRDRGPQPGVGGERQHRVGVGRALDQHRVGTPLVERPAQAPGRPGPVVPDPEHAHGHRRSPAPAALDPFQLAAAGPPETVVDRGCLTRPRPGRRGTGRTSPRVP